MIARSKLSSINYLFVQFSTERWRIDGGLVICNSSRARACSRHHHHLRSNSFHTSWSNISWSLIWTNLLFSMVQTFARSQQIASNPLPLLRTSLNGLGLSKQLLQVNKSTLLALLIVCVVPATKTVNDVKHKRDCYLWEETKELLRRKKWESYAHFNVDVDPVAVSKILRNRFHYYYYYYHGDQYPV